MLMQRSPSFWCQLPGCLSACVCLRQVQVRERMCEVPPTPSPGCHTTSSITEMKGDTQSHDCLPQPPPGLASSVSPSDGLSAALSVACAPLEETPFLLSHQMSAGPYPQVPRPANASSHPASLPVLLVKQNMETLYSNRICKYLK